MMMLSKTPRQTQREYSTLELERSDFGVGTGWKQQEGYVVMGEAFTGPGRG